MRHKRLELWLPVGGEIEPGETPLEAARRELREETGLEGVFPPGLGVDGTPPGLIGYEEHPAGSKGLHMNFAFVADVATRDAHRLRRVHRRPLGGRSGAGRVPAQRPPAGAPGARRLTLTAAVLGADPNAPARACREIEPIPVLVGTVFLRTRTQVLRGGHSSCPRPRQVSL